MQGISGIYGKFKRIESPRSPHGLCTKTTANWAFAWKRAQSIVPFEQMVPAASVPGFVVAGGSVVSPSHRFTPPHGIFIAQEMRFLSARKVKIKYIFFAKA
jgi:hypothetical protein